MKHQGLKFKIGIELGPSGLEMVAQFEIWSARARKGEAALIKKVIEPGPMNVSPPEKCVASVRVSVSRWSPEVVHSSFITS